MSFISKSFERLYPFLLDYYQFIDFHEYKIESNASLLVKIISSFAASKIKHPIIALFDNDTAGRAEMNKLIPLTIPENIKILRYPDISIAKQYPTIGPTGKKLMNINGYACSIEMYFGKDVLAKNGELIPIRWTSFNNKINEYQGEITEKSYVQNCFRRKLKTYSCNEFEDMEILLNSMIDAFK